MPALVFLLSNSPTSFLKLPVTKLISALFYLPGPWSSFLIPSQVRFDDSEPQLVLSKSLNPLVPFCLSLTYLEKPLVISLASKQHKIVGLKTHNRPATIHKNMSVVFLTTKLKPTLPLVNSLLTVRTLPLSSNLQCFSTPYTSAFNYIPLTCHSESRYDQRTPSSTRSQCHHAT